MYNLVFGWFWGFDLVLVGGLPQVGFCRFAIPCTLLVFVVCGLFILVLVLRVWFIWLYICELT